jgi:hydrogenase/urease accessory protein HupE
MAGFLCASAMLHLCGYGVGRTLSQVKYAVPAAGLAIAAAGAALIGG